jgi:ankyrin repeat protein
MECKKLTSLFVTARAHKLLSRFRWVICQLVYLRHCLPQRIRRALNELPPTLDATYERTLQDISEQNWEFARRLFHCVAAASRPLRVEELAEFLAFEFNEGDFPIYLPDWRPENPIGAVLSTCPSFLTVVNVEGSSVIQFAHFSVKEYLTSKRLVEAKDTISRFHVSMTAAHTIISQACLGVLLHIDENITQDDLKKFPLALYAAEHWVGHARFEDVSRSIEDGMKCVFDPNNRHLAVWVWIYEPESGEHRYDEFKRPSDSGARATPLHYAAFCGLHDIVKFLIVEHSQDVNARGFCKGETPLGAASRVGHSEVARVLLEHGADTEPRDNGSWSPLEQASMYGHVEVIQVLLEHGADANARNQINNPPLYLASYYGKAAAARVLLEHDADPNPKCGNNESPLHVAWNEGVARVLLEYGADTNAQDRNNSTPLHEILNDGSTEVARVFLENGADANARDSQNRTPLHLASRKGHLDSVRLLLQHSSDIHARDDRGRTPFQGATENGHQNVMDLLLEHGAEDHRT